MQGRAPRLLERLRRGHLLRRGAARLLRESQALTTYLVLGITRPQDRNVVIVTLNADEENASTTAALLAAGLDPLAAGASPGEETRDTEPMAIVHLSPDPRLAEEAVAMAARRLELKPPAGIRYVRLGYCSLLRAYRDAATSYSTHVLLPGTDPSKRRRHIHLTHGSGPKPDTTFRGPANELASITPQWQASQLREYGMPSDSPVIHAMPRLEVMRRSVGDRSILAQLSFDPARPLLVWAPTYRAIRRGPELRISGVPFGATDENRQNVGLDLAAFLSAVREERWQLAVKVHPRDADSFDSLEVPVFTNETLRQRGVTSYELFGAADLLVTDYSSIFTERDALGLPYALFCPDLDEFSNSYRSFRAPLFNELYSDALLSTSGELHQLLNQSK